VESFEPFNLDGPQDSFKRNPSQHSDPEPSASKPSVAEPGRTGLPEVEPLWYERDAPVGESRMPYLLYYAFALLIPPLGALLATILRVSPEAEDRRLACEVLNLATVMMLVAPVVAVILIVAGATLRP